MILTQIKVAPKKMKTQPKMHGRIWICMRSTYIIHSLVLETSIKWFNLNAQKHLEYMQYILSMSAMLVVVFYQTMVDRSYRYLPLEISTAHNSKSMLTRFMNVWEMRTQISWMKLELSRLIQFTGVPSPWDLLWALDGGLHCDVEI